MSPDERKIHIPSQLGSENLVVQLQILQRRLIAFSPQSADKLFQRLVFVTISAQLGTQMLVIRFHIPQIRFQRLDLAEISFKLFRAAARSPFASTRCRIGAFFSAVRGSHQIPGQRFRTASAPLHSVRRPNMLVNDLCPFHKFKGIT